MSIGMETPGKRLRYIRTEAKLSQRKLAEIMGVGYNNVGLLERGEQRLQAESLRLMFEAALIDRDDLAWIVLGD